MPHLRDLRRRDVTNIQTPRKGDLGPELKSIKIPGGARILAVKKVFFSSLPLPPTQFPIRKI